MATRIIAIPLDAYRSEKNAEVKDTAILNKYALMCRAFKKTLTDERSRKWARTE